jgi:hypothetical protein
MNIAKAIEKAIATVIRDHADLPPGVTIRCWQTLRHDATWNETEDRTFPMIEIRAAPPQTDDNQSTLSVQTAIIVGTQNQDDKDHAVVSDIYAQVQEAIDALFASFRSGTPNAQSVTFAGAMLEAFDAGRFNFGGFTYGSPLAPFEERGAVMLGIGLTTHYSRNDF